MDDGKVDSHALPDLTLADFKLGLSVGKAAGFCFPPRPSRRALLVRLEDYLVKELDQAHVTAGNRLPLALLSPVTQLLIAELMRQAREKAELQSNLNIWLRSQEESKESVDLFKINAHLRSELELQESHFKAACTDIYKKHYAEKRALLAQLDKFRDLELGEAADKAGGIKRNPKQVGTEDYSGRSQSIAEQYEEILLRLNIFKVSIRNPAKLNEIGEKKVREYWKALHNSLSTIRPLIYKYKVGALRNKAATVQRQAQGKRRRGTR